MTWTLNGCRISFTAGATLVGMYATSAGQEGLTEYAYIGFGPNVETFDEGMAAIEFSLTGCTNTAYCNFSAAAQPE